MIVSVKRIGEGYVIQLGPTLISPINYKGENGVKGGQNDQKTAILGQIML